ncbi:hypothetical protein F383_23436 [Gossypium arboreum]|uniref:Uncharacterized protein n=1 Tax=Gossypium arboreum TaxID=29729 RepID=A0A0B0MMH1_GOSAR|nr:hypothetical protein F383_23436 [Gossypium arboreum]
MYFDFLRDVNRPQRLVENLVSIISKVDEIGVLQIGSSKNSVSTFNRILARTFILLHQQILL